MTGFRLPLNHKGVRRRLAALLLIPAVGTCALTAQAPAAGADPAPVQTDRQPNPGLWGNSGLMTVPTAEVLPHRHFNTQLGYFPLNSGLSLSGTVSILPDLEAGLVFGVPPANGFAAIAGSIKYRIMNQNAGQPVSLALGASLLGLGDNPGYVPGSNAFLMLSRGFDWDKWRIVNLHGGFMGGIGGARVVAGLDVPVLDFARVELEYLGNINLLSQALNLGLVVTPFDGLHVQAALMQRPTGFWDRDFILSVGWRGDWGALFGLAPQPSAAPSLAPSVAPIASPTPSAAPSIRPPAKEKGNVRIRAIDNERIIALDKATVSLRQAETATAFNAQTDVTGEARFERIPVGTYEVIVQKDGWVAEKRMISVQENLETFLEIPLSGKGGTIFGTIENAGGGNAVDLDLEVIDSARLLIRRLNLDTPNFRIEKLPPGTYTLVVKQAGTERLRINILVKANTESQYDLTLPPTGQPTPAPTPVPTAVPSPTAQPTSQPTAQPSAAPTSQPTAQPTVTPPPLPSATPTAAPSATPSPVPSATPSGPVSAQIQGTIKAKGGAIQPGVRLELKNDDLLVITLTNNEGKYIFRDIPRGVYRLQLSKQGFKTRAFQITIVKSETLTHDLEIEAGQ